MIQIDMPMPNCCDECFALDEHGDYPYCLISQDQRGYTFNTRDRRMPTCPLKAQEPVESNLDVDEWRCGNCGHKLEHQELLGDNVLFHEQYNYCPNCGKAVKQG